MNPTFRISTNQADGLLSYNKMETDVDSFEIKSNDIVSVLNIALAEYQNICSDQIIDMTLLNLAESNQVHFDAKRIKQTFFRILDHLYHFAPENKKIFVVYKSSTISYEKPGHSKLDLPSVRFIFAKLSEEIPEYSIEITLDRFLLKYKGQSKPLINDIDLLFYENVIKAHRGEFNQIYIPNKGILFEIYLPQKK